MPEPLPIAAGLLAGGAPEADDLVRLAVRGVRTAIDIRPAAVAGCGLARDDEAAMLGALGIAYLPLPIEPSDLRTESLAALSEALDDSRAAVFVHCGTGQLAPAIALVVDAARSGCRMDELFGRAAALGLTAPCLQLRGFIATVLGEADAPPAPARVGYRDLAPAQQLFLSCLRQCAQACRAGGRPGQRVEAALAFAGIPGTGALLQVLVQALATQAARAVTIAPPLAWSVTDDELALIEAIALGQSGALAGPCGLWPALTPPGRRLAARILAELARALARAGMRLGPPAAPARAPGTAPAGPVPLPADLSGPVLALRPTRL